MVERVVHRVVAAAAVVVVVMVMMAVVVQVPGSAPVPFRLDVLPRGRRVGPVEDGPHQGDLESVVVMIVGHVVGTDGPMPVFFLGLGD